jgi:hypothetical protein
VHRTAALAISAVGLVGITVAGQASAFAKTGHPGAPAQRTVTKTGHPGAPAQGPATKGGAASPTINSSLPKPKGYKIVSATYSAPAGQQTRGTVTCPVTSTGVTRVPLSGGVVIGSSDVAANINASDPSGTEWVSYVNNGTASATLFTVYAVCAVPNFSYSVQSTSVDNPAGTQTEVTASCPSGTKVVGGGEENTSYDRAVNVNEGYPSGKSWVAYANNGGTIDNTAYAYAVCEQWSTTTGGYKIVAGTATDNPSGVETFAPAACPSGYSSLGGGVGNTSNSTAVNLNSTAPTAGGWSTWTNNNSGVDDTVTPYVICGL